MVGSCPFFVFRRAAPSFTPADDLQISRTLTASTQLTQWRNLAIKGLPSLFEDEQRALQKERAANEAEREKLFAEIGRLTSELNWLKKRWPLS